MVGISEDGLVALAGEKAEKGSKQVGCTELPIIAIAVN